MNILYPSCEPFYILVFFGFLLQRLGMSLGATDARKGVLVDEKELMRISLFGQLGLQASSQGCETSKRTIVYTRLRGFSGVISSPHH